METTPAASLNTGKEQGNHSVDARSEGQFWLTLCREDVCLETPQIVHCAISRVDTHGQRVVAFPEFPTATD
jgi:hypothetical protein